MGQKPGQKLGGGRAEEREVFGESHVNQGGPRRGEPNDRGNLLPGGQVYQLI